MKYKPIEMPRGTHYGNNYYEVFSPKAKRIVKLFSNLEYYNYLSLEINPKVAAFCEQPLRVPVTIANETKDVIFDMFVEFTDGTTEFQEVKYGSELEGEDKNAERTREQINRERIWCQENGFNFSIVTEEKIFKGRFTVENMNVMAARIRRYVHIDDYYDKRIKDALKDTRWMTFGEMKEHDLLPPEKELDHLCYLYAKGILVFNIDDRTINENTKVRLNK